MCEYSIGLIFFAQARMNNISFQGSTQILPLSIRYYLKHTKNASIGLSMQSAIPPASHILTPPTPWEADENPRAMGGARRPTSGHPRPSLAIHHGWLHDFDWPSHKAVSHEEGSFPLPLHPDARLQGDRRDTHCDRRRADLLAIHLDALQCLHRLAIDTHSPAEGT